MSERSSLGVWGLIPRNLLFEYKENAEPGTGTGPPEREKEGFSYLSYFKCCIARPDPIN